jgi:TRAP-type C4-dicarboxylate transport system permease small subunit
LRVVNQTVAVIGAIATGAAACVLTWEATARYLFKIPSDWQDEVTIFLLVGATFLSAAWVQQWRGHIGIQALGAILPPAADRIRRFASDIVTLVFCVFFCWKCWELLIVAVKDGQISGSAFGAPLWIPYGCMAIGMTLLVLVLTEQVLTRQSLQSSGE